MVPATRRADLVERGRNSTQRALAGLLDTWVLFIDDIDRIELNSGRLKVVGPAVLTAVVPPEADPQFHHWAEQMEIPLLDPQGRIEPGDDLNKRLGLWRRIFR